MFTPGSPLLPWPRTFIATQIDDRHLAMHGSLISMPLEVQEKKNFLGGGVCLFWFFFSRKSFSVVLKPVLELTL